MILIQIPFGHFCDGSSRHATAQTTDQPNEHRPLHHLSHCVTSYKNQVNPKPYSALFNALFSFAKDELLFAHASF
jgi:hypothetical protein